MFLQRIILQDSLLGLYFQHVGEYKNNYITFREVNMFLSLSRVLFYLDLIIKLDDLWVVGYETIKNTCTVSTNINAKTSFDKQNVTSNLPEWPQTNKNGVNNFIYLKLWLIKRKGYNK